MEKDNARPSWDDYFMEMLEVIKQRSTCVRRHVGAVIVRDHRIISTGYNGAPTGLRHCTKETCVRMKYGIKSGERHELCRATHAEQNAIISAARMGTSIEGAEIYITDSPCILCTKMLINAGIKRIVYRGAYPDSFSLEMLEEAGVETVQYEEK
jgi:dCMP deaminase